MFRKLRTPHSITAIKFRGRVQKLEAEAKVFRGRGERLRGRDRNRGKNFGLEALTYLVKTTLYVHHFAPLTFLESTRRAIVKV